MNRAARSPSTPPLSLLASLSSASPPLSRARSDVLVSVIALLKEPSADNPLEPEIAAEMASAAAAEAPRRSTGVSRG